MRISYPVVLIFGPTAVGKTRLLSRLLAGRAEIISADSMQVYRYMDIGTAKPSKEEQKQIPHHLIDIRNPDEQYNVGQFVHLADELIPEIIKRKRIPVVSGGTAFYFVNFIYGLPETPPGNLSIREKLKREWEERGPESLFRELAAADPESAERIGRKDAYRIIRALEVLRQTGRPLSRFKTGRRKREGYNFLIVGLRRSREDLYRRIEQRVDGMMKAGLKEEISRLLDLGYTAADPGMRGIGYREFMQMRADGCMTLGDVTERIKRSSRRYAKRQVTFFKKIQDVGWFHPEDFDGVGMRINRFLSGE